MINEYLKLSDSFIDMMLSERGASRNTIDAYKNDLDSFNSFAIANKISIINCSTENIRSFINHLYDNDFSSKTIARKISSLKQFYHFLFSESLISNDPTFDIDPPKTTRTLPKYLTTDEIYKLILEAKLDTEDNESRLYTMLVILYSSGIRVSELVSLSMSNLKMARIGNKLEIKNYLIIKGKGNKERIAPLNEEATEAIFNYLAARKDKNNDFLFYSDSKQGYITRQRFGQLLKQLAMKCNIAPEKVSPHILRHSFATNLLNNGANLRIVQELLGHSDISTTEIYTHISDKKLQEVMNTKHPLVLKQ